MKALLERFSFFLYAALLLLPGTAFACDGTWDNPVFLIFVFIKAVIIYSIAVLPVQLAWKVVAGRAALYGDYWVMAGIIALGLGVVGVMVVPDVMKIYAGFGGNLPEATLILFEYHYLPLIPLFVFPFIWYALISNPSRDRYFAAFMVGEYWLACYVLWALYSPAFRMC